MNNMSHSGGAQSNRPTPKMPNAEEAIEAIGKELREVFNQVDILRGGLDRLMGPRPQAVQTPSNEMPPNPLSALARLRALADEMGKLVVEVREQTARLDEFV